MLLQSLLKIRAHFMLRHNVDIDTFGNIKKKSQQAERPHEKKQIKVKYYKLSFLTLVTTTHPDGISVSKIKDHISWK